MNQDIEFSVSLLGTINSCTELRKDSQGLGDMFIPLVSGSTLYKIKMSQLKEWLNS